jgi:enoyl-CoA hydratase
MSDQGATTLVRSERDGAVGVVTIDRPDRLNALNQELLAGVAAALEALDADEGIRCLVLAGGEKAFAAGADIGELATLGPIDLFKGARGESWERIRRIRKPVIAAVSGFCLGGGCELAMLCDIIVCSPSARFGQPESNVGILPGAGGTQRLVRAVGKSVAMDVILSGRFLTAEEALSFGLVARVADDWLGEAKTLAARVAEQPPIAVRLAKELVLQAFELPLSGGIEAERRGFALALASEDAGEGLRAFLEKRKPDYRDR